MINPEQLNEGEARYHIIGIWRERPNWKPVAIPVGEDHVGSSLVEAVRGFLSALGHSFDILPNDFVKVMVRDHDFVLRWVHIRVVLTMVDETPPGNVNTVESGALWAAVERQRALKAHEGVFLSERIHLRIGERERELCSEDPKRASDWTWQCDGASQKWHFCSPSGLKLCGTGFIRSGDTPEQPPMVDRCQRCLG